MVNLSGLGVTDPLIRSHLASTQEEDEDKEGQEGNSVPGVTGVMNAFYYKHLDSKRSPMKN
jgi:hypothetical protein